MTLHYHGTPLTPRSEMLAMAGKCFCVSYAAPGDADWCQANGQSVMWDNGAFSVWRKGGVLDHVAFAKWVEPRLGPLHWAVVPDVIDGTVEQQREHIARWPHAREVSAPVWHMGLPIDWLLELADNWTRICFGSSGDVADVGSAAWCRKADAAFNALDQRGYLPGLWIHMLRGLAMCGKGWPFTSADSVNVARNFAGNNQGRHKRDPEKMARKIDAIQCPIRWTERPTQEELFSGVAA